MCLTLKTLENVKIQITAEGGQRAEFDCILHLECFTLLWLIHRAGDVQQLPFECAGSWLVLVYVWEREGDTGRKR